MFVCNCNGIREREVRSAAQAGASQAAHVFRKHACSAKCGRCIAEMQMVLTNEIKNSRLAAE
jgi:bacterioferritin-associated ferredoxin